MLQAFARSRFERCLERCPIAADSPGHERPWHLFETYATVTETGQGKRYKDWIFARVAHSDDDPIDVIQGGASLIMRDAVREFVREECSPSCVLSLDRPMAGESITLLDVLPAQVGPGTDAALREYERLAWKHAQELFPGMSERERIVLAAKEAGLSLANDAVMRAAGCGQAFLYRVYSALLQRVCDHLKAIYPNDDPESALVLALMTVRELVHQLLNSVEPQDECGRLFALAEERYFEFAEA